MGTGGNRWDWEELVVTGKELVGTGGELVRTGGIAKNWC